MSSVKTDGDKREEDDEEAVINFLASGNLDTLWNQFDINKDGNIDKDEFNNLVYTSLKFFCQERNPDTEVPTREAMQPFIEKLVAKLRPHLDKDNDMQISKEEFKSYGNYLTSEFDKLQKELSVVKVD